MANSNTQGFGLVPVGTLGNTPATQGLSKYWIEAASTVDLYHGGAVEITSGYVTSAELTPATRPVTGVLNGIFYNASTTLKPTWANWYEQPITPANSENIQAFINDYPFQEYVVATDDAVTRAGFFETYEMFTNTAGTDATGVSKTTLNIGGTDVKTYQWRLIREAEDPSNQDITAAYCSVIVCQNTNQIVSQTT
jgi:hypothetical protein|tara:strand:+ start:15 stop:599 length:585 start_codon:yes stop_codon:yes gene_type:complete